MKNLLLNLGLTIGVGLWVVAAPPVVPFEAAASPTGEGPIDRALAAAWMRAGVQPANPCSDAVFVRRVYLDVIGTLPTAAEARQYLADQDPERRGRLIDALLARSEFADYWGMKWGDVLRIKAEYPINLWPNAAQLYDGWVRKSLRENWPYDRFARELLTASGSSVRVPTANFYRAMPGRDGAALARAVALTFMGVRLERWPAAKAAGLTQCFSCVGYKSTAEWKEEIVYFDPAKLAGLAAGEVAMPDGAVLRLAADRDPREQFADWLVRPENPWFGQAVVNRIWAWLMGRGLVHEPDDLRPDNPASNPEVLRLLERELVASKFDLKAVYRLILNSRAYQLSCLPVGGKAPDAGAFACYPIRRLEAEVLSDALSRVTGTSEKYSSSIPEPFTVLPEGARAITLPDGSMTSSFLELFGRSPRDTGLDSERNNQPTASQRLHLLNSSHVQRALENGPGLQRLLRTQRDRQRAITEIYLTMLSRFPMDSELEAVRAYSASRGITERELAVDVAWALLNSPEFLCRH